MCGLTLIILLLLSTDHTAGYTVSNFKYPPPTQCENSELLGNIKAYLENTLIAKDLVSTCRLNPEVLWENVKKISNICDSDEALSLRIYCSNRREIHQAPPWLRSGILNGASPPFPYLRKFRRCAAYLDVILGAQRSRELHFCQLIPHSTLSHTLLTDDTLDVMIEMLTKEPTPREGGEQQGLNLTADVRLEIKEFGQRLDNFGGARRINKWAFLP